ncbi:MAG: cytochrome bc complex cytochrome b subunit, partial [Helicobacter sp.]|nr:cytochrome bc complex cytochrome b subunit [Helicobacter sp.]
PLLDRSKVVAPAHKRPAFFLWFWLLVADLIVLTIYGKLPPTGVNAYIGFVASITFLGLFVLLPIITAFEKEKAGGHS